MDGLILQDHVTVTGEATATDRVTQFKTGHLDLSRFDAVELRADVIYLSNVDLAVEVTDKPDERTWNGSVLFDATTGQVRKTLFLKRDQNLSTNFLQSFMRWTLEPTGGGAWQATFRLLVYPR
jgi:hypothetical protein